MELKYALKFLRDRLIALRKMRIYTEKRPNESVYTLDEIEEERKQIQKEVDYINRLTNPQDYK